MASSMWGKWFETLSQIGQRAPKRVQNSGRRWGTAAEYLEDRALLSASGGVAAEIADARHGMMFTPPNVAGEWTVTAEGFGTGTVSLTQKGAKVSMTLQISGLPEIKASGKFSKSSPDSLSGHAKVANPETGHKIAVTLSISFPEGDPNPATFTGTASVFGQSITLSGEKNVGTMSARSDKMATTYPDVTGTWTYTASQAQLGTIEGTLTITQEGKGNRFVVGQFSGSVVAQFTTAGKFDKHDLHTVTGKANIVAQQVGSLKAKFTMTFNEDYTSLQGTATTKSIGTVTFSADKQLS